MTAFTIFVFGGMSTEVALRCGVTRASQPQPAPDGVEMQPEMQPETQSRQTEMQSREKRASLAADAAAAAEGWLRPGGWAEGWGFGPVGAAGRTDLLGRDEGEDEGEGAASDEGADEGRPQARNNSGRLPLGLLAGGEHAMDHARRPRGAARRPCSLPRWLGAAIALVAVFALGTASGRPPMCAAPEPALPSERANERTKSGHAITNASTPESGVSREGAPRRSAPDETPRASHAEHSARVQRENGPTPADSHPALHEHEHHHEKKSNGENASQHHPHEGHGKVADGPPPAGHTRFRIR